MLSSHVLSRVNFNAQIDAFIQHLQTTTIDNVSRTDRFLAFNIAYNHLESSLRTNYFVHSVPGSRAYNTYTGYYLSIDYKNMSDIDDYCSCDVTYNCSFPSYFYTATVRNTNYYYPLPPPLYLVPGMLSGCIPRFSILQSILECFYDFPSIPLLNRCSMNYSLKTGIIPVNLPVILMLPIPCHVRTYIQNGSMPSI